MKYVGIWKIQLFVTQKWKTVLMTVSETYLVWSLFPNDSEWLAYRVKNFYLMRRWESRRFIDFICGKCENTLETFNVAAVEHIVLEFADDTNLERLRIRVKVVKKVRVHTCQQQIDEHNGKKVLIFWTLLPYCSCILVKYIPLSLTDMAWEKVVFIGNLKFPIAFHLSDCWS